MAHPSQTDFIQRVSERFPELTNHAGNVLEVGSQNINGTVRDFFANARNYLGIDLGHGKDVDFIVPGELLELPDGWADLSISTECFEHASNWPDILRNMIRITREGGLIILTFAGMGRCAHGTLDSDTFSSPFTTSYYRNLGPDDLARQVIFGRYFSSHGFEVHSEAADTYFWGIRDGGWRSTDDWETLDQRLARAQGQLVQAVEHLNSFRRDADAARAEAEEARLMVSFAENRVQNAHLRAEEATAEVLRLRHELTQTRQEMDGRRSQAQHHQADLLNLRRELANLLAEVKLLRSERDAARQHLMDVNDRQAEILHVAKVPQVHGRSANLFACVYLFKKVLSPRWIARKLRQISFRYIYPIAPAVHDFLFFQLRQKAIAASSLLATRKFTGLTSSLFSTTLTNLSQHSCPKVSIIVPCYNHEPFLGRRLSSIEAQSYKNTELILLDDASSDNSVLILRDFAERHPDTCRLVVNDCNSGSPFQQWQKGIKMATGDLIWIAESDDSCAGDFLEKIVPLFFNQAVMLAFCQTRFVAVDGCTEVWSMANYLPELEPATWDRPFTVSSFELIQRLWDRKNIIPNVSASVFRNASAIELLDDPAWLQMRVCGDWLFYLRISAGGFVSYTPSTTCYYRQHSSNISVSLHKDELYLAEHLAVAEYVVSSGIINMQRRQQLQSALRKRWYHHRVEPIPANLADRIDDLSGVGGMGGLDVCAEQLRILMVTYSLIPGGGEILPLRLANLLKERGHAVTVLECHQHSPQEGVRRILRPDIPLIQLKSLEAVVKIIDTLDIMIVHSHNAWVDTTIAELIQGACNACHVITSHGMYDEIEREDFSRIGHLLCSTVRQVAYVADKNVEPLLQLGFDRHRLTKISNAVDINNIHPIDRSLLGIDREDFVLCVVSRAIREKGWQEAIEAMDLAQSSTSRRLHLLIGGDGSERHRLQKLYGHRSEIHFLGFQASPCDVYAAADLGILPTFYPGESQPLTLLECLAVGRPFLTTCVGETSAMLSTPEGMAGVTIPLVNGKVDVAQFAAAILTYCTDTARHERDCGLAKIASQAFSGEAMALAYEQLYRRALNGMRNPTS